MSQRTPLVLSSGDLRPTWPLVPQLSTCFTYWVAMTALPSLKCSGDVACHRFSREGRWWAQWHSSERWPQWGQPTWRKCLAATRRPRWGRSFTTLQPWWPSRPTVQPSPGPTGLLCIHLGDGMLEQPSQPDGFATCWILQGAPACWVWGDWQLLLT